jgi:hypothetical protein
MVLWPAARRLGFEVSWLIGLTRQETSPTGPCLTLRLHWQLVIRHSSGHAISLSCLTAGLSGKAVTLAACVFIWGSSLLSCIPNPTISLFFYNNGEGPLQPLLKRSLSISHIMKSGDACPKGPRTHARSPPWQGLSPLDPILSQPTRTAKPRQPRSRANI